MFDHRKFVAHNVRQIGFGHVIRFRDNGFSRLGRNRVKSETLSLKDMAIARAFES